MGIQKQQSVLKDLIKAVLNLLEETGYGISASPRAWFQLGMAVLTAEKFLKDEDDEWQEETDRMFGKSDEPD